MKVKQKFFIFALILSLILSVGAVMAADDMTFDQSELKTVSNETNQENVESVSAQIETGDEKTSKQARGNEDGGADDILGAASPFSEIQTKVNNAESGDTIYLDGKEYKRQGYHDKIVINKSLTVVGGSVLGDGKYATLDASTFDALLCENAQVILKNIKFINGNYCLKIENGAHNSVVDNCIFTGNTGDGGCLWINHADNVLVKNSIFSNNVHVTASTGLYREVITSIYAAGLTVKNCEFTNNEAEAIFGTDVIIMHSKFDGHHSKYDGGALAIGGKSQVINCTFLNNDASRSGGAIYGYKGNGSELIVEECTFISNSAKSGAAILSYSENNKFLNNKFSANRADDGNAVFVYGNLTFEGNELNGGRIYAPKLMINDTEEIVDNNGSVVIPFPDNATGEVIVTINGKNYTGKIIDGKLVLDVSDLPEGNYTAVIYYPGDETYSNMTENIDIIKGPDAVSPSNPLGNTTEVVSDGNGTVSIPFPKDATGVVMVEIDGKYYTGRIVNGELVLDVGDMPMGNYNANVHYFGDGKYNASSRTIMFVIKETINNNNNQNTPAKQPAAQSKKATKITAKKKTFKKALKVKKYSITLKSGKTPLKKVQVTIKIGKKTYKAKTNKKGKATFKIKKLTKKGKYNAVVKFKGNKTYKATSKKVKITVK